MQRPRSAPGFLRPVFAALVPALLLSACGDGPSGANRGVETVKVLAGSGVTDTVNAPVPVEIQALDRNGRPARGTPLTFLTAQGGSAPADTTDAEGRSSVVWTLGKRAGEQTLQVFAGGDTVPVATLTVDALPGALAKISLVRGASQTGTPGAALRDSVVVRAEDAHGNGKPGLVVAFADTLGGGAFSPARVTTGPDGAASARWTLGALGLLQEAEAAVDGYGPPLRVAAVVDTTRALVFASLPPAASRGEAVRVAVGVGLEALGDRRGLLSVALEWDPAQLEPLSPLAVHVTDASEVRAWHQPAPGRLVVGVTRPRGGFGQETVFTVAFRVLPTATGAAWVRATPLALHAAGTFRDLLGLVSAAGDVVRIPD